MPLRFIFKIKDARPQADEMLCLLNPRMKTQPSGTSDNRGTA
ncbi:hypothetical protein N172_08305 [Pantoea dispersa EGD-AAK13]|nr:hypothetical protein N172_08305 [Pantoea dispersa EGD-AAK13]